MSKTYGQVLTEEIHKHITERMTSKGYDESQEKIARAVLLEFVRRVEELQEEIDDSGDFDDSPNRYHETKSMAFDQLSTELKEAK